jgi:hypothetical protein
LTVGRALGVVALLAIALALGAAPAGAAAFRVSLDPREATAQGNPDSPKTATRITVEALGDDGRPVRNAIIELRMTAPEPPALVRSDVPRIEGRELLRTRFGAPDGRFSFSYVLPMRGRYELDLRAEPTAGGTPSFAPFAQQRTFSVDERSGELVRFVLVLAGMFAFGLVSAIVLARPRLRAAAARDGGGPARPAAGRLAAPGVAPAAVLLALLALVFVGFLAADAVRQIDADDEAVAYQGEGRGVERTAGVLRWRMNRSSEEGISVQTLVETRGSVTDTRSGAPLPGAAVRIEALDLETGKPAFATEAPTDAGGFVWAMAYWDGVDYDVRLSALPGEGGPRFAPAESRVELAVQGLSPPLGTKALTTLYLIAPVIAGMLLGVLLARRRWGPPRGRRAGAAGRPLTSGA